MYCDKIINIIILQIIIKNFYLEKFKVLFKQQRTNNVSIDVFFSFTKLAHFESLNKN